MKLTRRDAVVLGAGAAGAAAAALWRRAERRPPPGRLLGPSASAGHRVRDGGPLPAPAFKRRTKIAIVGGGVAGLAAAWELLRRGERDFVLLELEPEAGGNAASGRNAVTAYPWGAHYVNIPGEELGAVRRLYQDLGLITGFDALGRPFYDEQYVCAEPQERLFVNGRWQEGLVPELGVSPRDRAQLVAFSAHIQDLRAKRGRDGRRAFVLPVDLSSRDPEILALDQLSMGAYLTQRGWDSPYLLWYVNYCCRDDFGAESGRTSAWAGLHYFAARAGSGANVSENAVLTWPEGNGHLVKALAGLAGARLETGRLALSVESRPDRTAVLYLDVATGQVAELEADAVVCAMPRFVAQHVVKGLPPAPDFTYAPWLVANLTLRAAPEGDGARLAWDNVSYYGRSLGYVVATHQTPRQYDTGTVITYYRPLTDAEPDVERRAAAVRSHADWSRIVLGDLEAMHPGIAGAVEELDTWVWGHGMIRPSPGFLWGKAREAAQAELGRIVFAHSDLSGLSLFEEAFTRGAAAATRALALAAGAVQAALP